MYELVDHVPKNAVIDIIVLQATLPKYLEDTFVGYSINQDIRVFLQSGRKGKYIHAFSKQNVEYGVDCADLQLILLPREIKSAKVKEDDDSESIFTIIFRPIVGNNYDYGSHPTISPGDDSLTDQCPIPMRALIDTIVTPSMVSVDYADIRAIFFGGNAFQWWKFDRDKFSLYLMKTCVDLYKKVYRKRIERVFICIYHDENFSLSEFSKIGDIVDDNLDDECVDLISCVSIENVLGANNMDIDNQIIVILGH